MTEAKQPRQPRALYEMWLVNAGSSSTPATNVKKAPRGPAHVRQTNGKLNMREAHQRE